MADYKIQPVIFKSGRRTRYSIRKGNQFLYSAEAISGYSYFLWAVPGSKIPENALNVGDPKTFRSRRAAFKKAEQLDRYEFRKAKSEGLADWTCCP